MWISPLQELVLGLLSILSLRQGSVVAWQFWVNFGAQWSFHKGFYDSMVWITITTTGSTLLIFLSPPAQNFPLKLSLVNQSYKFLFLPGLWRSSNCRKLFCPHLLKGKFWANIQCSWPVSMYLQMKICIFYAYKMMHLFCNICQSFPSLYLKFHHYIFTV